MCYNSIRSTQDNLWISSDIFIIPLDCSVCQVFFHFSRIISEPTTARCRFGSGLLIIIPLFHSAFPTVSTSTTVETVENFCQHSCTYTQFSHSFPQLCGKIRRKIHTFDGKFYRSFPQAAHRYLRSRLRSCTASAICFSKIISLASRSAIVRATRSRRS